MKITKIDKQKKYKNRYNIFLDGEFAFGLYDDTILKFGLRTNDELSEELIEEIRQSDEFNYGKFIAYSYLSYKQRSKSEIIKKLKEKKISGNVIDNIIELLSEQKYINDHSFARLYIENKLMSKPIGKRLLKLKLQEKGIDKETSEKVIEENFNEETELESAEKLLEKYRKKVRGDNDLEKKRKCFSYLISRGFDFDTANKVLENLSIK
ncbi:MAG TPA: RecX family transcriptional regulator [Ignavibacteria bacterium]|nr:RecX family transcriptional regulator [Ignavibacteria bacterium]